MMNHQQSLMVLDFGRNIKQVKIEKYKLERGFIVLLESSPGLLLVLIMGAVVLHMLSA